MQHLVAALLCLHLMLPVASAGEVLKDPLDYPPRTYLVILAIALLGGLVGWYNKVRAGAIPPWSVSHLIGELTTSALAGLLCFWLCSWAGLAPLLTAALAGIAGHMGGRAISMFEDWAMRRAKALRGGT